MNPIPHFITHIEAQQILRQFGPTISSFDQDTPIFKLLEIAYLEDPIEELPDVYRFIDPVEAPNPSPRRVLMHHIAKTFRRYTFRDFEDSIPHLARMYLFETLFVNYTDDEFRVFLSGNPPPIEMQYYFEDSLPFGFTGPQYDTKWTIVGGFCSTFQRLRRQNQPAAFRRGLVSTVMR